MSPASFPVFTRLLSLCLGHFIHRVFVFPRAGKASTACVLSVLRRPSWRCIWRGRFGWELATLHYTPSPRAPSVWIYFLSPTNVVQTIGLWLTEEIATKIVRCV